MRPGYPGVCRRQPSMRSVRSDTPTWRSSSWKSGFSPRVRSRGTSPPGDLIVRRQTASEIGWISNAHSSFRAPSAQIISWYALPEPPPRGKGSCIRTGGQPARSAPIATTNTSSRRAGSPAGRPALLGPEQASAIVAAKRANFLSFKRGPPSSWRGPGIMSAERSRCPLYVHSVQEYGTGTKRSGLAQG